MTEDRPPELGRIPITASIIGVQKAATSTMHTMLTRHRLVAPTFQNDPARAHLNWHFAGQGAALLRRREARLVRPRLHALLRQQDPRSSRSSRSTRRRRTSCGPAPSSGCVPSTPRCCSWRRSATRSSGPSRSGRWAASRRTSIRSSARPSSCTTTSRCSTACRRAPVAGRCTARSMVIRGLYGAQLERGLAQFPRESWLMLNFAEWVRDYQGAPRPAHRLPGDPPVPQVPAAPAQPDARAPRGHARRARPTSTSSSSATPTTWPVREAVRLRRLGLADASHRGRGDEPRRAGRQVRPQVRRPRRLTCAD